MQVEIGGAATGPLSGVRVLDLSAIVSGPLCAQLLGDLGADVIKVEGPLGDTTRWLGAEGPAGTSGLFCQLNRNKRSVRLDLKSDAGRDAFLELARGADVVLENFRPGVAERLGIGYETLRRANPGLIYTAITGFGPDGPYAEQPAYDMVIQGVSGFAKILGDEESPKLISNLIADKTSGMTALYAILAALYGRERNAGRGQRIDVPMIDAFSSFVWADAFGQRTFGDAPPETAIRTDALYRAWPTADGHVAMLILEDRQFEGICRALEREDLIEDERYATIGGRLQNGAGLFEIFETELRKWPTSVIVERAHRFGAPLGAVNGVDEFLSDAQVRRNRTVFRLEHPEGGEMTLFRSPARLSQTPPNVRRPPPALGEHTAEVLREAGLREEQIEALSKP